MENLKTGGLITLSQLKKAGSRLVLNRGRENVRTVLCLVRKYRKINRCRSLKKGYEEMAFVNLSLAEMCFDADNEALRRYEEKLTECE